MVSKQEKLYLRGQIKQRNQELLQDMINDDIKTMAN